MDAGARTGQAAAARPAGRLFIKICGCRRPEDAAAAAAAGADAVGMVLAPGFRRTVSLEEARRIRAAVPSGVLAVGVFVDQPAEEVEALAAAAGLDAVQLHGREDDACCRRLRARYVVLKAWDLVGPEPQEADWVLVEPRPGPGGGHGVAWDWGRVRLRRPRLPFLLAGGLDPGNVAEALAAARPHGVDVSSGVETDGAKDPRKMVAFCQAVRRWEDGGGAGGGL
jgi:phosphoribosylanthranilate isomerase